MATLDPQTSRPAVSVVVPFRGDWTGADRLVAALRCLDIRDGDELIVADNTGGGNAGLIAGHGIRVVRAARERSAYHARNEAARLATADWILFLDADCRPAPNLLAAYFEESISDGCGAVAGQILGEPEQASFAARYARSRNLFDHADGLIRASGGGAAAGNLLVRREAFEQVGGFTEGIRSGGDLDSAGALPQAGGDSTFARARSSITGTGQASRRSSVQSPATGPARAGSISATRAAPPLAAAGRAGRHRARHRRSVAREAGGGGGVPRGRWPWAGRAPNRLRDVQWSRVNAIRVRLSGADCVDPQISPLTPPFIALFLGPRGFAPPSRACVPRCRTSGAARRSRAGRPCGSAGPGGRAGGARSG